MDINDVCATLKKKYNCLAISFFKYKSSYILKGMDYEKTYPEFRFFILKDNELSEIKDKVLIDYFEKDNKVSDIVY